MVQIFKANGPTIIVIFKKKPKIIWNLQIYKNTTVYQISWQQK